jgi:hypothetical protein
VISVAGGLPLVVLRPQVPGGEFRAASGLFRRSFTC